MIAFGKPMQNLFERSAASSEAKVKVSFLNGGGVADVVYPDIILYALNARKYAENVGLQNVFESHWKTRHLFLITRLN